MRKQGPSNARRRSRDSRRSAHGHDVERQVKRGFQALAAALGLLLVATQLVDWLEHRRGPDTAMAAQFDGLDVRKGESLRDFLQRTQTSAREYPEYELGQRGAGMLVRIRVRGYAGTTLVVRWTLYDRATDVRVPGSMWSQIVAQQRPRHDVHVEVVHCWVPPPAQSGRYYVRFTIEAVDGRIRAEANTVTIVARDGAIRR
jgi:hypothetical protein